MEIRSVLLENECRIYGPYDNDEKGEKKEKGIFCASIKLDDLTSKVEYIVFNQQLKDSLSSSPVVGLYYSIQDVVVDKNRIMFILFPVPHGIQYSSLIRKEGMWAKIVAYDLQHNFQWVTSVRTNSSRNAFVKYQSERNILLFYSRPDNDKKIKLIGAGASISESRSFEDDIFGYSKINTENGFIEKTEELKLEIKMYMWVSRFVDNTIFGIDYVPFEKKSTGHLLRITISD